MEDAQNINEMKNGKLNPHLHKIFNTSNPLLMTDSINDPDKVYASFSEDEVKFAKLKNKNIDKLKSELFPQIPKFYDDSKPLKRKEQESEKQNTQEIKLSQKNQTVENFSQPKQAFIPPKQNQNAASNLNDLDQYPSKENGQSDLKEVNIFQNKKSSFAKLNPVRTNRPTSHEEKKRKKSSPYKPKSNDNIKVNPPPPDPEHQQKQEIMRKAQINRYVKEFEEDVKKESKYSDNIENNLDKIKKSIQPLLDQMNKTQIQINKNTTSKKLIAKSVGKLIRIYADALTEKLIDDLTFELIPILQEKEYFENKEEKNKKKNDLLKDCLEALKDLTFEQKKIQGRFENSSLNSQIPFLKEIPISLSKPFAANEGQSKLFVPDDLIKKVNNQKQDFTNFIQNDKLYGEARIKAYQYLADLMINEEFEKTVEDFDQLQDEFVNDVFKSEF